MVGIGPFGPRGPERDTGAQIAEGAAGYRPEGRTTAALPTAADREALAVIAAVEGIGPITLERLLTCFGGAAAVLVAARADDGARSVRSATQGPGDRSPSMRVATAESLVAAARKPEPTLDALRRAGVHVLLLEDAAYPRRLLEIELPPRLLFVRGNEASLEADAMVAVVGTRRPTDEGRRTAARIGAALARAGATVISGLALGIDGAAHAAVIGEGRPTIAVIGGGHDRLFPRAHDRLAEAIVAGGGAVISEHAPGVKPTRGTFPRRNRLISGLSDAVVVVEAGVRSGALVTAAWALEQGRECFLVPGSIETPQAAGCLAWLRDYGGVARIVAGVPQLLEDLGLDGLAAFPARPATATSTDAAVDGGHEPVRRASMRPRAAPPARPPIAAVALDVPDRERRILLALDRGATTVDELVAATGLPVAAILAGLTGLEGRGLAEEVHGRYRIPSQVVSSVAGIVDPAA